MKAPKKSCELICGCHVAEKRIVFCDAHVVALEAVATLRILRSYFADKAEGDGLATPPPFVVHIDRVLARKVPT